jgi:hypothetical protein
MGYLVVSFTLPVYKPPGLGRADEIDREFISVYRAVLTVDRLLPSIKYSFRTLIDAFSEVTPSESSDATSDLLDAVDNLTELATDLMTEKLGRATTRLTEFMANTNEDLENVSWSLFPTDVEDSSKLM